MSIDPLTEEYEDYTPYQFSSNQPVHAKELEGLESSNDLNKKTPTQRAYNSKTGNTDLAKLVVYATADFLESINTYVKEKIEPSDKDIGSTATSKDGGGENQKTTGKKNGDNISADPFLTGAPGAAKTGNNLKSNKDIMKAAADAGKLSSKVDKAIKSVKEVIKENSGKGNSPSDMVQVVTDTKDPNKNVQVRRDVFEEQQKKK